ncbi:MAG: hypothetical protein HY908_04455 [Myxococcales bacterium]|nr:hypothetical protein [Myxococcales bacterium]
MQLTDGVRRATASLGPAQYSAGKWFVTPFVGPIEEGDEIEALAKAVEVARRESHYEVFRGDWGD